VLCARVDAAPDDEDGSDPVPGVASWSDLPVPVPDLEPTIGPGPPPISAADLHRLSAALPPISAVVAAAYRAAGLADDPAPGWRRRTRLAALVPWIAIRDGRDASWRDVTDPTIGYVSVFDVRATWHFDRLVFDPNELRIAAIDTSRRREKRRVALLAIHGYYAWLRARAAAEHDGRWSGHAEQAFAELDALTGGWLATVDKAADPR